MLYLSRLVLTVKLVSKNGKLIVGLVVLALVVGAVVLAGESGLFKGFLSRDDLVVKKTIDCSQFFKRNNEVVSGLASPVTSVLVSDVTSSVRASDGTVSQLASRVASPVTSPVASAVRYTGEHPCKNLKILTAARLKAFAKSDFKKNPAKYTLSKKERQRVIDLYNKKKL